MRTILLSCSLCLFVLIGWRGEAQIYDTNNDVAQVFAGSGTSGFLNQQGTLAMFNDPLYVVADTASNIYVWDCGNLVIRKITPNGTVSTFSSLSGSSSTSVGGMAIDGNNTIWVTSNNGVGGIYEVSSNGAATFLTYTGVTGGSGICTDSGNNIYYTAGNQIFRISWQGVVTLFAGNTAPGTNDGNGINALFSEPRALAADQAGNIYVWDSANSRIRRVDQSQNVTTIAGSGSNVNADGVGFNASFAIIYSMCSDNLGNIIMACGNSIRKMTPTTNVVTMAGSFSQLSYANGAGSLARFYGAEGVCLSQGMVFVGDAYNQRVRQISFNPQPILVSPANLGLTTYAGLTINGLVGRTYQIQASPDLSAWNTVATVLLTSSPYLWFDLHPVAGNKYYRAYLLP
jgi:hypothetical protein